MDFFVDNSAKSIYKMILGRDIFTYLGLNLQLYDHIIEADDGPFKGSMATVVYLGTYDSKT